MLNSSQLNAAMLNATAGGDITVLFEATYTARLAPAVLAASWSCSGLVRRALAGSWGSVATIRRSLSGSWGSKPLVRRTLFGSWGGAVTVRRALAALWGTAIPARAPLTDRYASESPLRAWLSGVYTLTGAASLSTPVVTLTGAGLSWSVDDLEMTQDASSPAWTARMTVLTASPPETGQPVTLDIGGTAWALVVSAVTAERSDPVDGGWRIVAASPCAALADDPAEDALPHGGMASDVCVALCGAVDWLAPDYRLDPPALEAVRGASRLDAATHIAAMVGVLVSRPDGTLAVIPRSSGTNHAPHAVEATLDRDGVAGGVRLSPWAVADSIAVSGEGRAKTVRVTVTPSRPVTLTAADAALGGAALASETVTETIGLIRGCGSVSRPIAALVSATCASGGPVALDFWPGQKDIWASEPTNAPVTVTYQTTFFELPMEIPEGALAAHVLVEDADV